MGRESGIRRGQGKTEALQVLQKNGGFKNIQLPPEPECGARLFQHSKMVKGVAQGYTKPTLTVIWIQAL